jgi:hypothetical protein
MARPTRNRRTDRIQLGYKLAVVPQDDEHPDAVPELTRALRPE